MPLVAGGLFGESLHVVALARDAVEQGQQQATRRFALGGFCRLEADELDDLVDGHRAVDQVVARGNLDRSAVFLVQVLVVSATDDLLHDVAHRDDARRAAVLIDDHGDFRVLLLQRG